MLFEYKLKGKQVILALDEDFLPHVRPFGIDGSPLFARVHRQEERGLWLETKSFALCPVGVVKLYNPKGEATCRAHIFIPGSAIVSLVVFPGDASALENSKDLFQIGFRPGKKRRRTSSKFSA